MRESANPATDLHKLGNQGSRWSSTLVLTALGLWLLIAIGVVVVRRPMVSIYADFAVDASGVTAVLVHPSTAVVCGAVALLVPIIALTVPASRNRDLAAVLAIVLAIATGVVCCHGFFGPLIVTVESLK
jgi:hypothetical protein